MTLVKAPNVELLVSQFLRHDPDVSAIFGDNVFTELPANFSDWPACRITRVGGSPVFPIPLVLDRPIVQLDVWGGPKLTAHDGIETIRAVLSQRLPWTLTGRGTLGAVDSFGALMYQPDPTFDPARPRYICDVALLTRP